MKIAYALHVAVLIVMTQACNTSPPASPPQAAGFAVEVARVQEYAVQPVASAFGALSPFETVQLTTRVAGHLDALNFLPGQRVRRGEVLAAVDIERFDLAVAGARAKEATVQANCRQHTEALQRRMTANVDHPGLVSADDIGKARGELLVQEAQLEELKVATQKALLDRRDAEIRAPMDGVMETLAVERGQYVQVGTVLGTLVQRLPLVLRFQLAADVAQRVKAGQLVTLAIPPSEVSYTAQVTHIADKPAMPSNLIPLEAHVRDPNHQLRAGLFARVTLETDAASPTLVVLESAVSITENGPQAFVVQDSNVQQRAITVGARDAQGRIQVLKGLTLNDTVVVRGLEGLYNGAPVRISPREVAQTP